jgi:hypothetical protein
MSGDTVGEKRISKGRQLTGAHAPTRRRPKMAPRKETWSVKLDSSVRPLIEEIARVEEREPAQVVRRLINSSLAHIACRSDASSDNQS